MQTSVGRSAVIVAGGGFGQVCAVELGALSSQLAKSAIAARKGNGRRSLFGWLMTGLLPSAGFRGTPEWARDGAVSRTERSASDVLSDSGRYAPGGSRPPHCGAPPPPPRQPSTFHRGGRRRSS